MVFDYTHGQKAVYVVTVSCGNCYDRYYFHYLKNAKMLFESIKNHPSWYSGRVCLRIYDIKHDVCKALAHL